MGNPIYETIGAYVFVTLLTAVGWFSYQALVKQFVKKQAITKREKLVLTIAAVGAGCIVYGFFEPYDLKQTRREVFSAKLKPGQHLRIAHISDMHCDKVARAESKLVPLLQKIRPDLIVFTGDASNNPKGETRFKEVFAEVAKVAPLYCVVGNHDSRAYHGDETSKIAVKGEDWPGTLLNGLGHQITINQIPIYISGLGIDFEHNYKPAKVPTDEYGILLYHYPMGIKLAQEENFDLFCCGHTHGGQIRLPLYGAIVTESTLGKEYDWGLYRVGNTDMSVTCGVGMTALPVRFLTPPEVAVLDIQSNSR